MFRHDINHKTSSASLTLIKSLAKGLGYFPLLVHHILNFVEAVNKLGNCRNKALKFIIQDIIIFQLKLIEYLVPLIKVEDRPLSSLEGELTHVHARAPALDRVTGIGILVVIKLKLCRIVYSVS